jgi:hypothetical protein
MECETLSTLVAAAKAGRSQVLVLRGETGIGKTALLDVVLDRAAGCRVARAAGVESEMELAFAGLHQLCSPHLDRLGKLPDPQQEALGTAFGLRSGSTPDRFLVGVAVLALLSEVAEERPLVCVVDDAQWLDRASAQALEFVARRLVHERVAMVFAVRASDDEPRLSGLPDLVVRGLGTGDAAALLESSVTGVLDPRVRDRILAESHGNPLALLELPRGLAPADLAFGGETGHSATPLVQRLEQGFLRQAAPLPPQSLRLLLTAAAEPVGDVQLLWRAAERLGIGSGAAAAAEASGLIELRDRVRFRHPLVRSAVYRSATPAERREVHRALADVTDPEVDPDRRAWHRSRAAVGPDEDTAAELERSAGRAFSHGGLAATTPQPSWPRPTEDRSGTPGGHGSTCSGRRSPSRRTVATSRCHCCCPRPAGWNRSMRSCPGTPTWMRSPPHCSPDGWLPVRERDRSPRRCGRRRRRMPRARGTRSWPGSRCCSPTGTRPRRRSCTGRCGRSSPRS